MIANVCTTMTINFCQIYNYEIHFFYQKKEFDCYLLRMIALSINISLINNVIMKTPSSSSETTKKRDWIGLINQSVHTSDDIDIGDIDAVSRDFVVVKRGFVNIHYYYIPINKVEGWDGNVLWLKITEGEVVTKYERDIIPDPSRYFVKDYPSYSTAYYPEITLIPTRYARPMYTTATTLPREDIPKVFKCELCGESNFKTEDELSIHVKVKH
jgi:hypothetical protein